MRRPQRLWVKWIQGLMRWSGAAMARLTSHSKKLAHHNKTFAGYRS
jgi:hypothetical protein